MNDRAAAKDNPLSPERAEFRDRLLLALGGPWPKPGPLQPEVTITVAKDGYRIEHLSFLAEPDDRIPALLLVPEGIDAKSPAPGICIWHQHNGQYHLGKSEPAGLAGNPEHYTGVALAKLGYVVLCIDALGFEDRQNPELSNRSNQGALRDGGYERYLFLRYLVEGKTLAWKNILDMRRAVDYLQTRTEVLSDQLGCYGHSMGSTHTWLVGGWEPRLKALVGNCCLPTYRGIHREQLLHCFPNFVPGIYPEADTPDIAALTAPRAFHLNFGELDTGSPIDEAKRGAEVIAETYRQLGAAENFSHYVEAGVGHVLSETMWQKTSDFFARHLPIRKPNS
ncbi:MAG: hypothetical protein GXP26_08065 [Planctomycetes bacterium]|nr:hypothetical protein [Planctomycetota bacterium]